MDYKNKVKDEYEALKTQVAMQLYAKAIKAENLFKINISSHEFKAFCEDNKAEIESKAAIALNKRHIARINGKIEADKDTTSEEIYPFL